MFISEINKCKERPLGTAKSNWNTHNKKRIDAFIWHALGLFPFDKLKDCAKHINHDKHQYFKESKRLHKRRGSRLNDKNLKKIKNWHGVYRKFANAVLSAQKKDPELDVMRHERSMKTQSEKKKPEIVYPPEVQILKSQIDGMIRTVLDSRGDVMWLEAWVASYMERLKDYWTKRNDFVKAQPDQNADGEKTKKYRKNDIIDFSGSEEDSETDTETEGGSQTENEFDSEESDTESEDGEDDDD